MKAAGSTSTIIIDELLVQGTGQGAEGHLKMCKQEPSSLGFTQWIPLVAVVTSWNLCHVYGD